MAERLRYVMVEATILPRLLGGRAGAGDLTRTDTASGRDREGAARAPRAAGHHRHQLSRDRLCRPEDQSGAADLVGARQPLHPERARRRSRSSSPRPRTSSSTCATSIIDSYASPISTSCWSTPTTASRPSTPRNCHSAAPACCRSSRPSSTSCRWTSWATDGMALLAELRETNAAISPQILDNPALKTLPGNADATVLRGQETRRGSQPCQLDRAHAAHAGAPRPHRRRRRVRPVRRRSKTCARSPTTCAISPRTPSAIRPA